MISTGPARRRARAISLGLGARLVLAAMGLLSIVDVRAATAQATDKPPVPSPAAADLCVVCDEPAAVYRCRTDGAEPNAPPVPGAQIKCVTEISQRAGHARCRIDRSRALACDGTFITVTAPPPSLPGAAPEAAKPIPAPTAPALPDNKPPETVEALVKDAAKSTREANEKAGQQLDKASSAVGGAIKKSWECVASFFSRC